jgi:hypothetical protein
MAPSGLEDLFGNEISNGPNIENGDLPRAMVIAGLMLEQEELLLSLLKLDGKLE